MEPRPAIVRDDLLARGMRRTTARTARVSSFDHSGGNEDAWVIQPGETAVLADLEGPGCITHLWFTQTCRRILGPGLIDPGQQGVAMLEIHNALGTNWEVMDPDYYRKIVLRIYWDDEEEPSVHAPLGDFFCVGQSIAGDFTSLPFTVSVKEEERNTFGGPAALNCYLPMPFQRRCRIEVENQNDVAYFQYFYVDYELYQEDLPDDTLYFHAHWRRQNPCDGWGPDIQVNSPEASVPNLDGADNYVILETEGAGNYIGCNLAVAHFQGSWWGEGDDMIFIDEDVWPPSLHGTGAEDYFGHAWGMQRTAHPMNGTIVHEADVPGYQNSYRFHLADPVRFERRIRVTIEHGHANHLADDWSSTAYWYQTLPSPRLRLPGVEDRLPSRPEWPERPATRAHDETRLTDDQRTQRARHRERFDQFRADREAWLERRAEDSRQRARRNVEYAADLRRRWLTGHTDASR
ncbi:glycoside hydrolase family 172 protein [Nitriliruptor alkaliphilus]|uniref:glycoside hydrolase family 172 protein n=1 Tax=Nitriliruptor alkaliphilus TaxID=427918 RepID=UPI0009F983C1|nr:glycoside hydrolase family 172 protein [Nitriliruptor alkaliphilus]